MIGKVSRNEKITKCPHPTPPHPPSQLVGLGLAQRGGGEVVLLDPQRNNRAYWIHTNNNTHTQTRGMAISSAAKFVFMACTFGAAAPCSSLE